MVGTFFLVLITFGLTLVLITWRKDIKYALLYREAKLVEAEKVLLTDHHHQQVHEESVIRLQSELFFINKKNKYVWDETVQLFRKLRNIDEGLNQSDFFKMQGLSSSEVRARILEYGENFIKISVPPVLHLVIHEGLNPFFLFQAYTVILWTLQFYWKFAVVIAITSVVSVTFSVWETRRQNRNLRDKMKSESKVRVVRSSRDGAGEEVELSSKELVPGDQILLPATGGYIVECDAVLVSGSAVANESMLTGESIPVTKVSIPDETVKFSYDQQRQYILFQGTEIMQGTVWELHESDCHQDWIYDHKGRTSPSHSLPSSTGLCLLLRLFEERQGFPLSWSCGYVLLTMDVDKERGIMARVSSQQPGHFHVCRQSNVTTCTDGEQRFRPKAASEGGNLLSSHQTHQSLWWHRH